MALDTTKERHSCQSKGYFLRYAEYLASRYGAVAYRVAVDAGFTCPNRGADRSAGGCSYCGELGSRAAYSFGLISGEASVGPTRLDDRAKASIERQVRHGLVFLRRRYRAELFLLYFQAFSNTYGPLDHLAAVYDFALSLADFRELIVATRPDCIDDERAALLASYRSPNRDVWVELGLQSADDATLARVRRGHTAADFRRAFDRLRARGVKVACHLILGLPGENETDMMRSVDYVAALRPDAVKIHDLHIPVDTALYREYIEGELTVPCGRRHVSYLASALERLPPDTIIMRLTCDTPDDRRAAPRFPPAKNIVYDEVVAELARRGTRQGGRYRADSVATEEAMR